MPDFRAPDGRRLHFEDTGGEGPPVLCLPGLTRNHRDFDSLAASLAREFRVVRLDSRGRGGSDWAERPFEEYTIGVEASDALALVDHLGLTRIGLVGTSRGGILGLAMAATRPGLIAALALNDVGGVIEGAGLLRILATLGREPKAESFAEAAESLRHANARQFPDVSLERWESHARAIYRDEGGRPRLSYDPHLRGAAAAAIDADQPTVHIWPLFDGIVKIPLLVIRGENSDILRKETVEQMSRRHPEMLYVEIAGRGHAPFLDEPDAQSAIRSFLAKHLT